MSCAACAEAEREDGETRRCKTKPCLVPPLDPALTKIMRARDLLIRAKNAGEIISTGWILKEMDITLNDAELILLAEEEIRELSSKKQVTNNK